MRIKFGKKKKRKEKHRLLSSVEFPFDSFVGGLIFNKLCFYDHFSCFSLFCFRCWLRGDCAVKPMSYIIMGGKHFHLDARHKRGEKEKLFGVYVQSFSQYLFYFLSFFLFFLLSLFTSLPFPPSLSLPLSLFPFSLSSISL